MVATAIIGAAVVGAAGTAIAGSEAANAQKSAANKAANTQLQMYNTTRGDLLPYNQFGQAALPELNNLISGDPSQVQRGLEALPGYQFDLTQGLKSVQNSAAARGLGVSGAALKGAAQYATGLADNTYGAQYNRLMSAAGLGESAAAQTGNYATQTGQNVGNAYMNAGNAQAAGYAAMGNAFNSAVGSIPAAMMWNSMYGGTGGGGAAFGSGASFVPGF